MPNDTYRERHGLTDEQLAHTFDESERTITWNYRVVRQAHRDEVLYGIHEAYYEKDNDGLSWTAVPVVPVAESVEELRDVLNKMLLALERDVIVDPEPVTSRGAAQ